MYGNHFAPNSKRHIRQPGCMKTFKGMYLSIEVNLGLSTQSQFSIIKNHSYPDIGVKLLGVWGNEIVDSSANKGAQSRFIESEAHSGLIKSNLKELIFNKNLALHWSKISKVRQSKKFITFSPTIAEPLLDRNKRDLSTITSLFTGHGPQRYEMSKSGNLELSKYFSVN